MNAYTDWDLVVIVVGMGLSTLICRNLFSLLPQHLKLPESVQALLRYAPVAALTALVVPSVLLGTRTVEDMIQNQQLFPLVIGGIVFVKTKRADLTFVIGFLAYFTWPFV